MQAKKCRTRKKCEWKYIHNFIPTHTSSGITFDSHHAAADFGLHTTTIIIVHRVWCECIVCARSARTLVYWLTLRAAITIHGNFYEWGVIAWAITAISVDQRAAIITLLTATIMIDRLQSLVVLSSKISSFIIFKSVSLQSSPLPSLSTAFLTCFKTNLFLFC